MINLLPPASGLRIRYGRHNARLRKWVIGLILAIAGLLLIIVVGWMFIKQQTHSLQHELEASKQQLEHQKLEQTKKDAEEINQNIKIINQVLGKEIRFSQLIQDIGRTMSSRSVLNSLSLSKVDGAIDLQVAAVDHASIVQAAANLSDPKNNLFDKVDIVSIACSPQDQTYKCQATLKALFNKNTQTRYLSVAKGSGQ